MFGFGKKKKTETPQKKSTIDKLIMGAIVGGAIGSVVGLNLAPKKGKETREYLTQKGKDIFEKGKEMGTKIQEEIGNPQNTENPKKFFSRLKDKIFPKKEKTKRASLVKDVDLKKIPHESD